MSTADTNNIPEDGDADLDDFEDACDSEFETVEAPDLSVSILECEKAIQYFFNNKFDKAKGIMKPWAKYSMYHSMGNCVFAFLEAMLTFEQKHIIEAAESLKLCLNICNKYRRKNTVVQTIGKMMKRTDYESYTEVECHAELCYAESLLLKAMLTFMEDETLSSFIKGGIKIRACYNSYKECKVIMENRTWPDSKLQADFESGVCMGIGAFNLMISLLPHRVIKLLEFVGFSGDKTCGVSNLINGSKMDGIRQILCVMTILGYHLMVMFVLSHQDGDLTLCEEIIEKQMKKYPEGVWFLFFKARILFMKANLNEAIKWYKKSWQSQNQWQQFHHMCYWELLWIHCMKLDWKEGCMYASMLVQDSRWSKTIYSYQQAAIMCMITDELSVSQKATLERLMRDVPKYKQRIAGKSLPMEKFAIKKSERYFEQGKTLVLPIIELMFIWNLFKIFRRNFNVANNVFKLIDKALQNLNSTTVKSKYDVDNRALVLLLKGACLRQMNSPLQALDCLETVVSLQKDIKEDTYLVPYAITEIGLLAMDQEDFVKAVNALEDAKRRYSGYSCESRLHFKIHAALSELRERNLAV